MLQTERIYLIGILGEDVGPDLPCCGQGGDVMSDPRATFLVGAAVVAGVCAREGWAERVGRISCTETPKVPSVVSAQLEEDHAFLFS